MPESPRSLTRQRICYVVAVVLSLAQGGGVIRTHSPIRGRRQASLEVSKAIQVFDSANTKHEMRFIHAMRGGEHNYAPHPTFCHYALSRSLKARKLQTILKNIPKFPFVVQIEIFQKNTFFDLPCPIVGSVTQHIHVHVC